MLPAKTSTILLHIIGWVLLFGLIVGFATSMGEHEGATRFVDARFLGFMVVYLFLFYFNGYFLVPRWYLKGQYGWYFLAIGLLLLAVVFLRPFEHLALHHGPHTDDHRPPPFDRNFGPRGVRGPHGGPRIDITSIMLFLMVMALSSAMQVVRQWRAAEQRMLQAEADKAQAELSFLKAQIHPHFLFNSLNNIYSLAVTKSERTADAVLKLSNILRYTTDEAARDLVPLPHEVACLADYIDLQRLRLGEKATVDFSVSGKLDGKEVPPLILMTFVENVFKYGISSHEASPITIRVEASGRTVTFYSRNRIFNTPRPAGREGVGLLNARRRLEHLYPGRFELSLVAEEGWYTAQLTLQVKNGAPPASL